MAKTPAKTASKTSAAKVAAVAAAAGQDTSAAAIATDTVAAIVTDSVSASVAGDTVAGAAGGDSVVSAGGEDAIASAAGGDTVIAASGGDTVVAAVGDGALFLPSEDAVAGVTGANGAAFTTADIPYSATVEVPADVARELLATSEAQGGAINLSELASIVAFDPEAGIRMDGRELRVRSVPKEGRRRAGMAFTPEPVILQVDDLTGDQLGLLLSDPELVVELD